MSYSRETIAASLGKAKKGAYRSSDPPQPVPHEKWPAWAKGVATLCCADDIGVGDTVKNRLGVLGAAFKAWAKAAGIPCGCAKRQALWNVLYPYNG